MPTTPPSLTPPGTAPSTSDPVNFDTRADALVAWLSTMVTEMTAALANVYANAVDAYNNAVAALAAKVGAEAARDTAAANAANAAASAGATEWTAGSYATGTRKWSTSNQRLYRRLAPGGSSPTDPASDPTNWGPVPIDLPTDMVSGTTATIRANARTRCTNAAAVALTFPTLATDDVVEIDFENGRRDNSFNIGAQTIKGPNGSTATGVITHTAGGFIRLYFNGTHIRSAQ